MRSPADRCGARRRHPRASGRHLHDRGLRRRGLLPEQATFLWLAFEKRRNVLVAGCTSKVRRRSPMRCSRKSPKHRVVLIEDTRELQCKAANLVALRTKDGIGSLSDLVRSSLRLRPDRIPIGEVRPRAVDYAAHIKNALDAAAINVRRAKPVRRMSGWTCGI